MTNNSCPLMIAVVLTAATFIPCSSAQESRESRPIGNPSAEVEQSGHDESRLPEAEFVASTTFRSASVIQPLWNRLSVEAHYFGGEENNVGYTAGSWTFRGEHWKLAPGFGVAFGDNGFRTMPALSLRWGYERGWFITEGLYVQGLLHTNFFPEGTEPEGGNPEGK